MNDVDTRIKSLVGDITQEQLTFIDTFVSKDLACFIPIGGSCGYAVTPWHTHPSYMFLLPYDSETTIVLEDKKVLLEPNTLFCLSPNIAHHEIQNYYPPKYCAIFIKKDVFENLFLEYQKSDIFLNGKILELRSSKIDFYLQQFLLETLSANKSISELLAQLLTHEIIRTILQPQTQQKEFTKNHKINEIVKYINTHFDESISLEFLATMAELSKSHLSKLFSEEMGISVMEYLKDIRLQNAKKMLLSNSLSVTQVMQQCGFSSPSYFSKLFKQKYNVTPKELIKRGYL